MTARERARARLLAWWKNAKQHGETQERFAAQLGVTQNAIHNMLRDGPRLETLDAVAEATGIPPEAFVAREIQNLSEPPLRLTGPEQQLLVHFRAMDDPGRRTFLRIAAAAAPSAATRERLTGQHDESAATGTDGPSARPAPTTHLHPPTVRGMRDRAARLGHR